jgi:trehalose-6-phosphate synthase
LIANVEAEAERINQRFQTRQWKPIVFLKGHLNHDKIEPYYRMADICLVTSLHDGMNLVAKEFVATRSDEDGVLVLSLFAGASLELEDALIVNPYDTDQVADAIHYALEMDPREKKGEDAAHAARGEALQHLPLGGQFDRRSFRSPSRSHPAREGRNSILCRKSIQCVESIECL